MPRMSVSASVSTIAGRNWRRSVRQVRSCTSGSDAAVSGISDAAGAATPPARSLLRAMRNLPSVCCGLLRSVAVCSMVYCQRALRRQVERNENEIDQLDANERQDDAADAVEQEIAPQQRRRTH